MAMNAPATARGRSRGTHPAAGFAEVRIETGAEAGRRGAGCAQGGLLRDRSRQPGEIAFRQQNFKLDQQFARSITLENALKPEPLLAYALNGEPLRA